VFLAKLLAFLGELAPSRLTEARAILRSLDKGSSPCQMNRPQYAHPHSAPVENIGCRSGLLALILAAQADFERESRNRRFSQPCMSYLIICAVGASARKGIKLAAGGRIAEAKKAEEKARGCMARMLALEPKRAFREPS
jgi:hypothetical protein